MIKKTALLPALLTASVLMTAASASAVSAAPDIESQVRVLTDNYSLWENAEDDFAAMSSIYSITDLDKNGLLEVHSMLTTGSGIFSYIKMYEINESLDGLTRIELPWDGDMPDSFLNLSVEDTFSSQDRSFTGYYDLTADSYIYFACDSWRGGIASNGRTVFAFRLKDHVITSELIGKTETTVSSEDYSESTVWTVGDTEYASEESWFAAMNEEYSHCVPFTYQAPFLRGYEVTDLYTELLPLAEAAVHPAS
ncbi:MAG: hypothetical protein Q4B09_00360 [Lachnospiraceae bacterium]|nr:hypothetical protein [Lachnospiraceae bacterium]